MGPACQRSTCSLADQGMQKIMQVSCQAVLNNAPSVGNTGGHPDTYLPFLLPRSASVPRHLQVRCLVGTSRR